MKKLLIIAAVLLATTIALTACGDDEPREQITATATYSRPLSQDLLEACNVFITYQAENGRNVHEAVLTPRWTKTVTSTRFRPSLEWSTLSAPRATVNWSRTSMTWSAYSSSRFTRPRAHLTLTALKS